MPPDDLVEKAIWQLEVCNACRYCEGYCAVFPAMERRQRLTEPDVYYLANLCHDCRPCYYACMYAPPHEFAVNIPQTFSEVRRRTYSRYALPGGFTGLTGTNFRLLAMVAALSLLFFGAVVALTSDPAGIFSVHDGPGAFEEVIPYAAMFLPAVLMALYAVVAIVIGVVRFWGETRGPLRDLFDLRALVGAGADALTVRFMQGGEDNGCYYPGEGASKSRWLLHLLVFWGFIFAFIATSIAFVYQDILGTPAPYPILSLPVMFGSVGGIGMIVGATGLVYLKWRSDPAPSDQVSATMDYSFLAVLDLAAITGMLLLGLRGTPAMGSLLIIHLAMVFALFVTAPYGKLAHFVYRYLALVQNRIEARQQP